jgi:hypothetical protein
VGEKKIREVFSRRGKPPKPPLRKGGSKRRKEESLFNLGGRDPPRPKPPPLSLQQLKYFSESCNNAFYPRPIKEKEEVEKNKRNF